MRASKLGRSASYRRQISRDLCDSHFHTHLGGKREDLYVNISHRQHSTPLLLYSTLSAVCVPLTVPVGSFHHLHSFSQPHTLTAPPHPFL